MSVEHIPRALPFVISPGAKTKCGSPEHSTQSTKAPVLSVLTQLRVQPAERPAATDVSTTNQWGATLFMENHKGEQKGEKVNNRRNL